MMQDTPVAPGHGTFPRKRFPDIRPDGCPWDPGLHIGRIAPIIGLPAIHRRPHAYPRRMNAVSQPQRYLINVEQYHKMGAAGVFPDDARVELIEGELLSMAPMGMPHIWAVATLTRALLESPLGRHIFLLPQLPILLSDITEPQPDLVLARLPAEKYRTARVTAEDVVLLIEVSDSTLSFDRKRKMQLYARHAIAEYWILNVRDRQLEVHHTPANGTYSTVSPVLPGTTVCLQAFPDLPLDWSVALT